MPFLEVALRRAYIAIANLSWSSLALAALAHMGVSYVLLAGAGEGHLADRPVDFLYYYVTTATTVGYGDLSPMTAAGRWAGLIFVLPGSIAIFTAVLGKGIADLGAFWRRRMNGYGDYTGRRGHTVVLGWQGGRTRRLIDLLLADHPSGERIVLVARELEQNPMPDAVDLVRADSLSTRRDLARAGLATAGGAVVRGRDDDETLAATLAAASIAPDVHIVAYFEDERSAELIGGQCPGVEPIGSLSSELLVRSARDPGSSRMADLLFSAKSEDTAFSMAIPDAAGPLTYLDAMIGLKRLHGLTLVGVGQDRGRDLDLNCDPDRALLPGERVFYIGDQRVEADAVSWDALAQGRRA